MFLIFVQYFLNICQMCEKYLPNIFSTFAKYLSIICTTFKLWTFKFVQFCSSLSPICTNFVLVPTEGQCSACPAVSDIMGDHAVSCGWGGGERIFRHNMLRDCLFTTCATACLGPRKEDRALIPGTNARPADIFLPGWSGGKDTALYVTVVNPLQQQYLHQSAVTPGHALVKAHDRKMATHWENCRAAGIVFQPLAIDTLGAWGESTIKEVKKIGCALARQTGGEESEVMRHLVQCLSVILMRINANLMINRGHHRDQPQIDWIEWTFILNDQHRDKTLLYIQLPRIW